jgi:hypothetical protein
MGKLMPKTKGHAEFDRWWKDWISKSTQNRDVLEPRASGKKPGAGVEHTADARPGNLAHEPDAAPESHAVTQQ